MIDVINFKGKVYPRFQSTGNASSVVMGEKSNRNTESDVR